MVIHDASDLRQSLSDELHARAFYDFEGAGRFIRFVYLVGNDDNAVLNYVNDYLQTRALPLIQADEKSTADTIIDVMDEVREAGVIDISIASEPNF